MAFEVGAVLSLRDTFSATIQGIRKENKRFREDVQATRKALEETFEKKRQLRIENSAATRAIRSTVKALEPLRDKVVTTVAYKDMIKGRINETTNKLKVLGTMVVSPIVNLKDQTSNTLSKIKDSLLSLKTLAAGIVLGGIGAGVGKALESGAMLEKQMISIEHFIGIQNKGKSQEEIKKMGADYLKQLRENANLTPFSDQEVIAGGTRALTVAGGDTKQAMELLKLAENMAALNPEKTLSDAMEALADLKVGETERMKEFGFKISQDDIKKAGGVQSIINKQIQPFFEGGAAKLSQSASGLWSTITGKLGSKVQDIGFSALEKLKPVMQQVITWMDKFSPVMDQWGASIGSGIATAIGYFGQFASWIGQYLPVVRDIIGGVSSWISEKFGWLSSKTGFLKEVFSSAWSGIQSVMNVAWKILKPLFDFMAANVKILASIFEFSFPYIKDIISTVWDVVSPILEKLGDALGWVADKAGKIAEWLGHKVEESNSSSSESPNRPVVDGSHATGLDYVPRNGYIAELHKGEGVLTASENAAYQQSKRMGASQTTRNQVINITINGVNKSTNEIVNELVPQLKMALENA